MLFNAIAPAARGVPAWAKVSAAAMSSAGKLGSIAVTFKSPLVKIVEPVLVPPVGVEGAKVALVICRPAASTTLSEPAVVVPCHETEISVLPPSSRRSLLSIVAASEAPEAESGARLLIVMVLPPIFIPKEAKSPAAAGELKATVGNEAEVGTCATYLAPKSELALRALAKDEVVSSLVASTGTEIVFLAPSGPNVKVTESVGTPLVLRE